MTNKHYILKALSWLERAQDQSEDGGVAAWYSLVSGWVPSYIETTGYIINTFLEAYRVFGEKKYLDRAMKMGDFLIYMQLANGGFRTHVPSVKADSQPTVFNTGQDLLGLAELYAVTKKRIYLDSLTKAAAYLISIQEKEGSWLKNTYGNKTHVYHTRVAWGLLETWKVTGNDQFKQAAIRNLDWAMTYQQANGWFRNNELPPPNIQVPYTHTISYALEGLLFSGLLLKQRKYIMAACKGALPPLHYFLHNNFMPGTFDQDWKSKDRYSCLTGNSQLAVVWLKLFELTSYSLFLKGSIKILSHLKGYQDIETLDSRRNGAIAGSSPIWGDLLHNTGYCRMAYLNWATKFYIDALFLEQRLVK